MLTEKGVNLLAYLRSGRHDDEEMETIVSAIRQMGNLNTTRNEVLSMLEHCKKA